MGEPPEQKGGPAAWLARTLAKRKKAGSGEPEPEPEERARRILVVEDNEVNLQLCVDVLGHGGYEVLAARSGEEALEIFEKQMPDLVLLDVVMPGLSGLDVLEALRRRYNEHQLPVIMATAKDQSEDVVRAFRLGANDYVTKPLDFAVTLARIEAQLRGRRGRAAEGATDHLAPGSLLEGKYRIEELLGRGNFGAVYRATHLKLKRPVAVKVLRTSAGTDRISFARFEQEGVSLSRLDHPHAVSVLDFSSDENGLVFLVMELLEGRTLDDELYEVGKMSAERCLEILRPLCEVLAAAHALGIIHRDIKPQNIFLHRRQGAEVVKMLDFGIAKLVGDAAIAQQLTLDGNSVGTPAYMAPERFLSEPYDGRSDVYSLGVTLYEMLAGQPPFQHSDGNFFRLIRMHVTEPPPPLENFAPGAGGEIDAVVRAALAKDPDDRPAPLELAARFAAALASAEGAG